MTDKERLEQCFLPLVRRAAPSPSFFRIIGLDEAGTILPLLKSYARKTQPDGCHLRAGLANPGEAEIQRFFSAVGEQFVLSVPLVSRHATVWLGQVKPACREQLSLAVWEAMELLRGRGANENVVKNTYVKFMCWFRSALGRPLRGLDLAEPPKVLFEGAISRHEALLLHTLHRCGCDVLYVHFTSGESYEKADPEGRFSQMIAGKLLTSPAPSLVPAAQAPRAAAPVPPKAAAPTPVKPATPKPAPLAPPPWKGMAHTVELNAWAGETPVWEAVLRPNGARGTGEAQRMRGIFAACFGADERTQYRNRLFHLKRGLETSGKKWLLLEGPIPAPTAQETAPYQGMDKKQERESLLRALAARLEPRCGKVQCLLAQRAFYEAMTCQREQDAVRLFNHGVRLACWLRRYGELLFEGYRAEQQPALVVYSPLKEAELGLLWALASMGVDVLYLSPDPAARAVFAEAKLPRLWLEVDFPASLPWEPFPQREEKQRASTTAYNASRELDQLLYSDTGMFRDRQFARSQPITLKTTYDEVGQLWREPAQYRPSFEAKDGAVYVPNLFSKLCGVDKGDEALYWERIREMVTENTYLAPAVPFLQVQGPSMSVAQARSFLHDGRLDPKAIKTSRYYQYDYLPDDIQDYILEKIQALIDYDLLVDGGAELPASMLSVLMNLDKELLRLLQNFDFTREIPKFIVVDATEAMFSLEECILLAFLNLVGFDVAVFTPTGYRNLEKHLRADSFDTLTVGEYRFDLTVPDLRQRKAARNGDWLSRLFGGKGG